jgi:hypothetical protein
MSVGVLVPDGAAGRSAAAAAAADESADPEAGGQEVFALALEANVAHHGARHGLSHATPTPKKIVDAYAAPMPLIAQPIPPPRPLSAPGPAQDVALAGPSSFEPATLVGSAGAAGADPGIAPVVAFEGDAGHTSGAGPSPQHGPSPSHGTGGRETPRIENPAAAGLTHTVATQAAPESPNDSAKTLTAVKPPSPTAMTMADAGRGRLRDATTSVANRGVLSRGVVGEIELPELGRVVVRAETRGGSVDVRIESDRADTHATLYAAAPEVTADLQTADVKIGQLQFALAGVSSSAVDGSSAAGRATPSRERANSSSEQSEEGPPGERPRRRVRIVL